MRGKAASGDTWRRSSTNWTSRLLTLETIVAMNTKLQRFGLCH
jgi:hypothetical protein